MKNIHILPTDKPGWVGRFIDTNNLFLRISNDIPRGENVNIYITNSEEIKEGDWCLEFNALGNKIMDVCKAPCIIPGECILIKIILTTDPTLIADGVQAIDDKFLEWFVENPNCNKVEVELFPKFSNKLYGIIIPKEEPKQIKCYCGHTTYCDCSPLEEPKQETLEEAAENYANKKGHIPTTELEDAIFKQGFLDGAKWQAERMYSEEDMKKCWNSAYIDALAIDEETYKPLFFEDFIEQLKKK